MGKLAIGLAGALMLTSVAFTAQAQTQGAGSIQTQAQNATIIHKTACAGFGRWCRLACAASAAPPVAGARPASQRIAAFAMSRSEAVRSRTIVPTPATRVSDCLTYPRKPHHSEGGSDA